MRRVLHRLKVALQLTVAVGGYLWVAGVLSAPEAHRRRIAALPPRRRP